MAWPTRRDALLLALGTPTARALAQPGGQQDAEPAATTRHLAAHYPVQASLGYVTALIWQAQRGISPGRALPPRSAQALQALRQTVLAAAVPADWPRRAGCAAFADAAVVDGDDASRQLARRAVAASITDTAVGPVLSGLRPWTDDLFMPALLFGSANALLSPAEQDRAAAALGRSLLDLATRLQRPDGLFDHAEGSPVAWGRGNGFASLGLALALAGPVSPRSPVGAQLLRRLQAHLSALIERQGPDGLWRQVLDQAASPGELTVTAMSLTALATARGRGWLPAGAADAAMARAWTAVHARIDPQGGFADVCASTPAGPTLDFYLQRPLLRGRDDRAAAMVMQAAAALV